MGIGLRLKEVLRDRKMTIKQLSELSGVSHNTLYSITKRDSERIDPILLEKIAAALRVSTGSLLGGGSQIKYKIKQWKSRKDAHLDMAIDAELLQTVQSFADHDGISLEDEVEKLLLEYTDIIIEEATNSPENK